MALHVGVRNPSGADTQSNRLGAHLSPAAERTTLGRTHNPQLRISSAEPDNHLVHA